MLLRVFVAKFLFRKVIFFKSLCAIEVCSHLLVQSLCFVRLLDSSWPLQCAVFLFFVLLFIPPFCALITSYRGFGNVIVQITFVVNAAILEIASKLEKELEVQCTEK